MSETDRKVIEERIGYSCIFSSFYWDCHGDYKQQLDDFRTRVETALAQHPQYFSARIVMETDYYDDNEPRFYLYCKRYENDKEYDKRMRAIEAAKKRKKDEATRKEKNARRLYEQLKAKFEPNG